MKIKYCKDCKNICKPSGAWIEPHPESICMDVRAFQVNYITGEFRRVKCKNINIKGKCKWFKEIQ